MSDKAPWYPTWFTPEDIEGYERLAESIHDMGTELRSAAKRCGTQAEMSAFLARMRAIASDADEWTRRLQRVAKTREDAPENA